MNREKKKFDDKQLQDSTNPYKSDFLSKIPSWLKILILKYWAAAAAVFFVGIGGDFLGLDWSKINDANAGWLAIDLGIRFFTLLTLFLALVMNYIVKMFALMFHNSRENCKKYLFVSRKGFLGFLMNIGYNLLIMFPIFFTTVLIAKYNLLPSIFGNDTNWGLEPFSMGLFYIFYDFIFLFIKNVIVHLYKVHRVKKINNAE